LPIHRAELNGRDAGKNATKKVEASVVAKPGETT
jgi:hypothetical protein